MNISGCRPDRFALFLYVRPDNKVKLDSVMVILIITVFLSLFYNHSFIAEEGGDFYRFVVAEFYTLQSIPLFQPFQVVIIVADIAVLKSGIQRSPMCILRNFLVWIKRFFGWSSDHLLFG